MNINKPDDDIELEIKKMKLIDCLGNEMISSEEMASRFGFCFVRNFVMKLTNVSDNRAGIDKMKKDAKRVLNGLYKMKPIDVYPEAWL